MASYINMDKNYKSLVNPQDFRTGVRSLAIRKGLLTNSFNSNISVTNFGIHTHL